MRLATLRLAAKMILHGWVHAAASALQLLADDLRRDIVQEASTNPDVHVVQVQVPKTYDPTN